MADHKVRIISLNSSKIMSFEEKHHNETRKMGARFCNIPTIRHTFGLLSAHPVKDISVLTYLYKREDLEYERFNCSCSLNPSLSYERPVCQRRKRNIEQMSCGLKLPKCDSKKIYNAFPKLMAVRTHPNLLFKNLDTYHDTITELCSKRNMNKAITFNKIIFRDILIRSYESDLGNIVILSSSENSDGFESNCQNIFITSKKIVSSTVNSGGAFLFLKESMRRKDEVNKEELAKHFSVEKKENNRVPFAMFLSREVQFSILRWIDILGDIMPLERMWIDLVEQGYDIQTDLIL